MDDSKLRSDDNVTTVVKSTSQVLAAVFENLKTSAGVKADGSARLFFPNGIELISVKVSVNLKDGISVDVKVAGEKGISGIEGAGAVVKRLSSSSPAIDFLDPREVPIDWEGPVKIVGRGFDTGSFALFDGHVPRTLHSSDTVLEVNVTKDITSQPGEKVVKVHTAAGEVSNEVTFAVNRGSA